MGILQQKGELIINLLSFHSLLLSEPFWFDLIIPLTPIEAKEADIVINNYIEERVLKDDYKFHREKRGRNHANLQEQLGKKGEIIVQKFYKTYFDKDIFIDFQVYNVKDKRCDPDSVVDMETSLHIKTCDAYTQTLLKRYRPDSSYSWIFNARDLENKLKKNGIVFLTYKGDTNKIIASIPSMQLGNYLQAPMIKKFEYMGERGLYDSSFASFKKIRLPSLKEIHE